MLKHLKQKLNDEGFNLNLIGRARKMKIVLDNDYVIEKLDGEWRQLYLPTS